MFGQNKIENQVDEEILAVNSIFYTIQGEGPFAGWPATFIRLAGCNLKCYFCDTEFEKRTAMKLSEVLARVLEEPASLVVITGGEPFRQNIVPLCSSLHELGITVQVETAGTLSLAGFDWQNIHVVVSPKTPKVHEDMKYADAWKYLTHPSFIDDADGLPLMNTQRAGNTARIARPLNEAPIYVQPLDFHEDKDLSTRSMEAARDISLKYGYRVSLQTHKILGVE